MKDVSYELKSVALEINSYHVLSVTVDALSIIHWDGYMCAQLSGSIYSKRSMRESLIDILYDGGYLKIAEPEHSSDAKYEYERGTLIIRVKYFDCGMGNAGDPQEIANNIHSTIVKKMNGAVARHFEIFTAYQMHLDVVKKALTKESGGDGK